MFYPSLRYLEETLRGMLRSLRLIMLKRKVLQDVKEISDIVFFPVRRCLGVKNTFHNHFGSSLPYLYHFQPSAPYQIQSPPVTLYKGFVRDARWGWEKKSELALVLFFGGGGGMEQQSSETRATWPLSVELIRNRLCVVLDSNTMWDSVSGLA